MMDPMTALSVSASIVQFVDFSVKLVSKGYEIYRAPDGALQENLTIEILTADFRKCSDKLLESIKLSVTLASSEEMLLDERDTDETTLIVINELALKEICHGCDEVAKELLAKLERLKFREGSRYRIAKSVRQALKLVWSKEDIDVTSQRLKNYREQLDTRILVSIRQQLLHNDIQHKIRFDHLDRDTRNLYEILMRNQTNVVNRIEVTSDLVSKIVISENQKTRALLEARLQPSYALSDSPVNSLNVSQVSTPRSPSPRTDALHEATFSGNMRQVREIIENGQADVNALNDAGKSALHFACMGKNANIVEYLYREGARITRYDRKGMTPLHYAAKAGSDPVVRFLLRNGADPTIKDDSSLTPAFYAKDDFLIGWMFKYGYDIESRNPGTGRTALIQAAADGLLDCIKSLVKQDANIEATDHDNNTALQVACVIGHLNVVEFLVSKKADIEHRDINDWTPALQAVWSNSIDILEYLMGKNANIEARTSHSLHTCLSEAIYKGNWQIACLLVRKGADITVKDLNGYTVLHKASECGSLETVSAALMHKADPNTPGPERRTALHYAAEKGYLEVIEALLESKANINARDERGYTPLCRAAQAGRASAVTKLLEFKADMDSQNDDGWTALAEASFHGFLRCAELLLSAGAKTEICDRESYTPLCRAAQKSRVDCVRLLLKYKADTEAQNWDQWAPLAEAAHHGCTENVVLLLEHGANLETTGEIIEGTAATGWTPLMRAARNGHIDVLRSLLDRGADIHKKDSRGFTALAVAVECEMEKAARFLLEKGADIEEILVLRPTSRHGRDTTWVYRLLEKELPADTR